MTDPSAPAGIDLPFRQPAAAPAAGTPAAVTETHSLGGLTVNEQRQLAQWEVEGGRLTQQQADEMLRADGIEPMEQRGEGMPPVSDAAIEALANSYKLPSVFLDERGEYSGEMQAADRQSRQWMATAGFPANEGTAVVQEVATVADRWAKMTTPERALFAQQQKVLLERVWGSDYAANLALTKQLVSEIEKTRPGLVSLLEESGAGNSAMLANLLLGRARAIQHARASLKRA